MARVYRDSRMRNAGGKPAWCITFKGLDGRRCRERTQAVTREEAEAILRRRMSELSRAQALGLHSIDATRPVAFEDFVRGEYLPHSQATNRPSTYKRKIQLAVHVLSFFGRMALRAINAGDVERFIVLRTNGTPQRGKAPRHPSPAEINRERAFLCATLNMALRRGLIDRNPVPIVKKLHEDNERDRTLSREEEDRLMEFLGGPVAWLRPIAALGLQTGMRLGEILGLKWANVDRVNGFIRVGHASKAHKVRYIPINSAAMKILNSLSPFVGPEGPNPHVFVNAETGQAYTVHGASHAFTRMAQRAGLEEVTFHTLRHTVVSRLVQAGVSERKIMSMIGHSSTHMVSRYAHLAPTDLRDVAEVLANPPNTGQIGVRRAKELATGRGAM